MRAKIILLSLATVLTGAILIFALNERTARREAERKIDGLRKRHVRPAAEANGAEQQLAALEKERAEVKRALEAARQTVAKAGSSPTTPIASKPLPVGSSPLAMESGPQMEKRLLDEARARFGETYGPLARQLNLTEAQTEQLVENSLKRYEQRMDFHSAIGQLPSPANDVAMVKAADEKIEDEFRAGQTALLGVAGYEKFDFYTRTTLLRRFADDFAGKTTVAGVPVTDVQADRLIEAMAAASGSFRAGQTAQMEGIDWPAVFNRAAAELSEPQLAMFRNAAMGYWSTDRLGALAQKK